MAILVHAVACTKAQSTDSPLISTGEATASKGLGHCSSVEGAALTAIFNALKPLEEQGIEPQDCFVIVTFKPTA